MKYLAGALIIIGAVALKVLMNTDDEFETLVLIAIAVMIFG